MPDDVKFEMGLETFEYEKIEPESFEPESFSLDTFKPETFEPESLGITYLRRGVIGVSKIGYVS